MTARCPTSKADSLLAVSVVVGGTAETGGITPPAGGTATTASDWSSENGVCVCVCVWRGGFRGWVIEKIG